MSRANISNLEVCEHKADVCVIGGGMAGICAAIAAARHGAMVVLMHDRPVLGGNASSECRVHICGADRHNTIKHMRETGILEEIRLENLYRNHAQSYSIWDTVLYEKVRYQENLTLLLNCSCLDAQVDQERIISVTGWQLTTQTYHRVEAKIFIDCSGDAILAPLTGALYRVGREARSEFNESIAPEVSDKKTMGMTCAFMSKRCDVEQPFIPPKWAYKYLSCDELPYGERGHKNWWKMGYWWIELGGEQDSIKDTEKIRDELLKIVYGVWDHIKNHCPHTKDKSRYYSLEWIQFLPAKRESRRYIGEYVLTQNDIESGGKFEDIVAYGGWPMDDHHPAGFYAVKIGKPATIFHPTPSPYGIPYRCLFSRNIKNLMFAGRNASCTHAAMSSTRVMGTCSVMGQAAGTAAALCVKKGIMPAQLLSDIHELQQTLIYDDCYLPGIKQELPEFIKTAILKSSSGNPEPLRDGINRQVGDDPHCWEASEGDWVSYEFIKEQPGIKEIILILDSAMDKLIALSLWQKDDQLTDIPPETPKEFTIEIKIKNEWRLFRDEKNNYQRMVKYKVDTTDPIQGIKFTIKKLRGAPKTRVYAFIAR